MLLFTESLIQGGINFMEKCINCFITNKFPGVVFDEQGLCNFCSKHKTYNFTRSNLEELKKITDEIKRDSKTSGNKFDCIIGASGGIDSSYIIYNAVKKLEMNPLIVKYDNGCNNDLATENLFEICKKLDLELRIIRSKKEYDKKFIKYTILALKNIGLFWGVCDFCDYCLKAVVYREALKENITVKLRAYNMYEDGYNLSKKIKLKAMFINFFQCNPLKFISSVLYWIIARYYLLKLKSEFSIPELTNITTNIVKKPKNWREINVSRYVPWDIPYMVTELSEKLNWKYPQKTKLPMRFDCRIETLIDYSFKKVTGITVRGLICNNLLLNKIYSKQDLSDAFEMTENDDAIRNEINKIGQNLGIAKDIL